jgi:hypothetical protein
MSRKHPSRISFHFLSFIQTIQPNCIRSYQPFNIEHLPLYFSSLELETKENGETIFEEKEKDMFSPTFD